MNYYEFIDLSEPYFNNNVEHFNIIKQITYSKLMNRRVNAIINKPLSEIDLSSILYLNSLILFIHILYYNNLIRKSTILF